MSPCTATKSNPRKCVRFLLHRAVHHDVYGISSRFTYLPLRLAGLSPSSEWATAFILPLIFIPSLCSAITDCDGLISPTPECYDRMSIIGNTAWMAETSRGAYHIGPIVSRGAQAVEVELAQADGCAKIRDFVSAVLKSHGPNSLLYVSLTSCTTNYAFDMVFADIIWYPAMAQGPRETLGILGCCLGAQYTFREYFWLTIEVLIVFMHA